MDLYDVTKEIQLSSVAPVILFVSLAMTCTSEGPWEGEKDVKWMRLQMQEAY